MFHLYELLGSQYFAFHLNYDSKPSICHEFVPNVELLSQFQLVTPAGDHISDIDDCTNEDLLVHRSQAKVGMKIPKRLEIPSQYA